MSEEIVKIEIPNNGLFAYYPVFGGCFVVFLLAIFISQEVKDFIIALAAMATVGIIGTLLIKLIEPKDNPDASWGSPNIYVIRDRELKSYSYSTKKPKIIDLSKVYKIKYMNHKYRKYIDIDYTRNGEKHFKGVIAPFFEKCNDDWQRLFDEIRKRIPGDAEVIVK